MLFQPHLVLKKVTQLAYISKPSQFLTYIYIYPYLFLLNLHSQITTESFTYTRIIFLILKSPISTHHTSLSLSWIPF